MVTLQDKQKIKKVQAIIDRDKKTIKLLQANIVFMTKTIKDFRKTR